MQRSWVRCPLNFWWGKRGSYPAKWQQKHLKICKIPEGNEKVFQTIHFIFRCVLLLVPRRVFDWGRTRFPGPSQNETIVFQLSVFRNDLMKLTWWNLLGCFFLKPKFLRAVFMWTIHLRRRYQRHYRSSEELFWGEFRSLAMTKCFHGLNRWTMMAAMAHGKPLENRSKKSSQPQSWWLY